MKRGKYKSGQVTLFIILAILIIGTVIVFFIVKSRSGQQERISPTVMPIHNYVDNCIKETAIESLNHIGQTGGYFIKPNLSTQNNIAYYFYNGNNYMPTKEIVEKELSLYMNNMLFFCIKGFTNFPDFNVSQKEINTQAKIQDNKVVFSIVYPISASKNGNTYSFEKFSTEVPIRLDIIYKVLGEIMQTQMQKKADICITCLDKYASENDLYIDMYNYDKNTVIFTIRDENSKLNSESYKFSFANNY